MEYILEINEEKEEPKVKTSIRSSRHKIFPNKQKQLNLESFIEEYKRYVSVLIDYVWENGHQDYFPLEGKLDCFKFPDPSFLKEFPTTLGGMLRQTAGNQTAGILKSATEKQRKRIYQLKKLQKKQSKGKLKASS